jgi:hypothetical protein
MSYPEMEIPAADLALPADLLSHVSDLLECMEVHAMDSESALYLGEAKKLVDIVLTQFNRWSPKEER